MNRLPLIVLSLIFFCLPSLNCSSLHPDRPAFKKKDFPGAVSVFDSIVRSNLEQQRITGAAVALVHEGRVIFSHCYRYADTQKKVPITEDTYFMVGSLTKSFTALAVLKLIEEGKIDLNADIKTYIPDFSIQNLYGGETLITVNHLLTHTSGLMIDYYVHLTREKKYSNADLLSQLKKEYLYFKTPCRGSSCLDDCNLGGRAWARQRHATNRAQAWTSGVYGRCAAPVADRIKRCGSRGRRRQYRGARPSTGWPLRAILMREGESPLWRSQPERKFAQAGSG